MELKAQKQSAQSDWVTSVAFSPDGNTILSGKEVYSVAFSPDGKTILSGSGDKAIKVWDAGVLALTLQPLAQT